MHEKKYYAVHPKQNKIRASMMCARKYASNTWLIQNSKCGARNLMCERPHLDMRFGARMCVAAGFVPMRSAPRGVFCFKLFK